MAAERLDAAWEAATEEANSQTIASSSLLASTCDDAHNDESCSTSPPPQKSSLEYNHDKSTQLNGSTDLLYEYDDPFLLPSNETSPTSLLHPSSIISAATSSSNENDTSLLSRYRTFLQKNDTLLSIVEMLMERFLFYGHLFKSHHNDDNYDYERGILRTEMYYAAWNVIRWMNDVVLVGGGGGMGLTVGSRVEWLSGMSESDGSVMSNNSNNAAANRGMSLNQWISIKLEKMIPIIRATLTATTCIYPAVEAFSRRSIQNYRGENDHWDRRKYRAALVTYRLERVRFMGRMCLLVISWWARLQRKRQQQQQLKQSQGGNGHYLNSNTFIPSILQRGGELDPYEELVPLKDAEDEANVVQYVGRRTGRRSISNAPKLGPPSSTLLSNIPIISKATNLMEWISKLLASSSVNKVAYIYAVGEILHIVRPLYWSRAQSSEWKRRCSHSHHQSHQHHNRGRVSNSWSIWKAWWVSLLMDLISDKLLRLTNVGGGEDAIRNNRQGVRRGSSFIGRRRGKQSTQQQNYQSYSSAPSSAEEAKLVELEWRSSRHGLYLLRSPMYDVVTLPVASFIARVVSMIPSMGLGRWAAEYVLDMMSYWNDNHFMLES